MSVNANGVPVGQRIKSIRELLKQWEDGGVPAGIIVPRSLNQLRVWDRLPDFGILPGFSKRDFNRKHSAWGSDVIAIDESLAKLKTARSAKRMYQPERVRRRKAESKLSELEQILFEVTAQWHRARDESETFEMRKLQSDNKVAQRDAEIAVLKKENADLIRTLNPNQILRVVT